MWLIWNTKSGPDLYQYMKYDHFERAAIREELTQLIENHNQALED